MPSAPNAQTYAGLKKQRGKSREQHCEEKLMELLLLNCPDLSPCSYLIREGNKRFGPEHRNAQLFHLLSGILNTIVPSVETLRAVSVLLRSHGQCIVHIIHSVTSMPSDLYTLQGFLKEWDTQKYLKFVYDVQTSLLRLLALLEVCTSRLPGNKEI